MTDLHRELSLVRIQVGQPATRTKLLSSCDRQEFHPTFPVVGSRHALVRASIGAPISRLVGGLFGGFLSGGHFGTYAT